MKNLFILLVLLLAGCASDPYTANSLRALKQDYLAGKMTQETYLRRAYALKHTPKQKLPPSPEKQKQQARFYRQYQNTYTHPQIPQGPGIYCSENLDGGISCEQNVYNK